MLLSLFQVINKLSYLTPYSLPLLFLYRLRCKNLGVAGVINTDSTLKNKTLSSFQGDKATGSCDDLLTGGMYYVTSNVTNKPSGVNENGLVLTLGTLSNYRFQIFTPALSLDVYMRKFIFSAWTTWVKLT